MIAKRSASEKNFNVTSSALPLTSNTNALDRQSRLFVFLYQCRENLKSLIFPKQPTGLPLQNDAPTLSFWEWGAAALVSRKPSRVSKKIFASPNFFAHQRLGTSRPTGDVHYFSPTRVKSVCARPR